MSENATLMGLPVELREMIWAYTVMENDPIPSYVLERVVRAGPEAEWENDLAVLGTNPLKLVNTHPTLERKSMAFPKLPAVARVNRQTRQESLTVFFQGNILAFSLSGEIPRDESLGRAADNFTGTLRALDMVYFAKLWTVRLEFGMYTTKNTKNKHRVTIDVKLDKSFENMSLTIQGGLELECVCDLTAAAAYYMQLRQPYGHSGVAIYAMAAHIESKYMDEWRHRSFHIAGKLSGLLTCGTCQKRQLGDAVLWSAEL
ncbi:hypothetical protein LTR56_008098 [Elasticomyces elasticus]|nr:hypothetical protein LTR56_008098 [Elasticomyces elasticus]KAK3662850.1 hypothetical protein LTR22_006253 [Elasticomyces elasticus]KAK4930045.1 hypothetical protein LTR49_003373 [Elasticomyces elasticus]KAK5763574.1 hypothetical protein LTS12_006345 [Elasticomyces elasticus]